MCREGMRGEGVVGNNEERKAANPCQDGRYVQEYVITDEWAMGVAARASAGLGLERIANNYGAETSRGERWS